MMEIKRSSWHYKFNNFSRISRSEYNDSLCSYFWRLVGKIVFLSSMAFLFSIGTYGFLISPFIISNIIFILFIISCIAIPIIVIHYLRKIFKKTNIPGENLIKEYIKAKERKICPLITYID